MAYVDDLLQTSAVDVMKEFEAISEQIALLERKRALVGQLIDLMFQQGGDAATELSAYRTQLAVGPLRHQIRQVLLGGGAGQRWLPVEVHEQLQERGNTTVSVENVRVTMTRMVSKEELERFPLNEKEGNLYVYRLPEGAYE